MNIETLRQRIYSEPRRLDAGTLEQIRQHPELQAELEAVLRMDARLGAAYASEAPVGLLDDILGIPRHHAVDDQPSGDPAATPGWLRWVLALPAVMAALALGIFAVTSFQNNTARTVESYLAEHYDEDGQQVLLAGVEGIDPLRMQALMQRVGLGATAEFSEDIQFVKTCPTPGGPGAHMVVNTSSGLATIIYMPEIEMKSARSMTVGDQQVEAAPLEKGSVAVMAPDRETARQLIERAREGFQTGVRT